MTGRPLTPEEWQRAGRTFPHHGHEIFYRDSGSGANLPVLLLIHGFPTASWDFYRVWDALAARFRVLAPDLIGFGYSAKPRDYAYSLLDQAELCANLCARQQCPEVHVLAHDYGVSVAQELLTRQEDQRSPVKLKSIVFLNGGLFPETHRPLLVQKLLRSPLGSFVAARINEPKMAESLRRVFGPGTPPDAAESAAFWRLISHNKGQAVMSKLIHYIGERKANRHRWIPAMQFTKVPLRLIDGPADPVSGEHMVQRYEELIPNPDVVRLEGIGHYPQVEAPDAVLEAFFAFHDRLATRR